MAYITTREQLIDVASKHLQPFLIKCEDFDKFEQIVDKELDSIKKDVIVKCIEDFDEQLRHEAPSNGTRKKRIKRTIICIFGKMTFYRTLFIDEYGIRRYWCDELLGIPERSRFSADSILGLLENVAYVSYGETAKRFQKMSGYKVSKMAIYMIMYLGLRIGEAVAVCGDDIDGKDGTVYIRHAFKSADRSVGDPKTEAGKRILPLPNKLYDKLKTGKKVVENELGETEYVCCNTLGNLLYTESLYDWGSSFLSRNSLSKIDLHELRHTNFTFIGRHASLFDLKHFAGWSTLEPAKRYVHNNQDMLRKAIDDAGL